MLVSRWEEVRKECVRGACDGGRERGNRSHLLLGMVLLMNSKLMHVDILLIIYILLCYPFEIQQSHQLGA